MYGRGTAKLTLVDNLQAYMAESSNSQIIPARERKKLRDKKIRAFYRLGYSMEEICSEMRKLGEGVSKTTVFFAINGRSKKSEAKRRIRKALLKIQK